MTEQFLMLSGGDATSDVVDWIDRDEMLPQAAFVGVSRDAEAAPSQISDTSALFVPLAQVPAVAIYSEVEVDADAAAFAAVILTNEDNAAWTYDSNRVLLGTDDNDGLFSLAPGNTLIGRGGDDMLTSEYGADTLIGGDGRDVFVIWMLDGWAGPVRIMDFEAGDMLISADASLHAVGRDLVTDAGLVVVQMQSAAAATLAVAP